MIENHKVSIIRKGKKLYLQYYLNGKRKQKSTTLDDTPQNRKIVINEIIPIFYIKLKNGEFNKKKQDEIKEFSFYADNFLLLKEKIKSYQEYYNSLKNIILPYFGAKKVNEIKKIDIKNWVSERLRINSPRRVRKLLNLIHSVFEIAIEYEHIRDNPAKNIKLPYQPQSEKEPFTPEEVKKILDAIDEFWFKVLISVGFYTGMRSGEIIGLMWSDIDFENKIISVKRRIKKGKIDTPKTKTSIRQIPLFANLEKLLLEHKKNSKSLFVFTNIRDNKPLYDVKSLHSRWTKAIEKSGVKYRILYNTRHTFITNMLKNSDLSMFQIAQIVGHSNTEMIMKNYARFIKGEQLKVSRNIDPFAYNSAYNEEKTPKI